MSVCQNVVSQVKIVYSKYVSPSSAKQNQMRTTEAESGGAVTTSFSQDLEKREVVFLRKQHFPEDCFLDDEV